MTGVGVALITPFSHRAVDFASLDGLLAYLSPYADAFVVLGTTGEPYTLTSDEKDAVVRFVCQRRGGKRVIVGVEGNDTARAVAAAAHWRDMGADALLCITPYCNKCTQEGLFRHYAALSDGVDVPLIVYNVPSRTGVNVAPDTLARIATLPHVMGIKEASGDADQIARYAAVCHDSGLSLYCGDDALLPLFRVLGAKGIISAAANALPQLVRRGWGCALHRLAEWNARAKRVYTAMFSSVNPIGVKYACARRGLCRNELRLPLTPMSANEDYDALLASFPPRNGFKT